jgi:hypothetical protein
MHVGACKIECASTKHGSSLPWTPHPLHKHEEQKVK